MPGRRAWIRDHADVDAVVLMRPRWVVLMLSTMCVAACSPTTEGQPEGSPPPPPSSTATALAPIDGFPDMSGYTEANHAPYLVSGPPSSGANLLTPDGMNCWLGAFPMPEHASVSCFGPRPDQGPGIWEV